MDTVWGETRCYHPVAKSCLTFCSRDRARTRTSWLQSRVLPQQAAVFPKVPWEMVGAGREPSGVGQALVHAEDREAEPLGPEGSLQTFWFLWGCWGPSLLQGKQVIFWLAYFFDCSWVEFSNWVCQKNWCRLKMSLLLSKAGWNWEAQGKVVRRGPCRWDPALVLWLPRLLLCNLRSIPHHEHPLLSSASPLCVFCPLASSRELPPTSFKSAWPCLRNVLKAPRSLTANTEALALEGQDFPWPLRHPSPAAAPCFSSCPPTAWTSSNPQRPRPMPLLPSRLGPHLSTLYPEAVPSHHCTSRPGKDSIPWLLTKSATYITYPWLQMTSFLCSSKFWARLPKLIHVGFWAWIIWATVLTHFITD